jgi:dephospho-CoA kinase
MKDSQKYSFLRVGVTGGIGSGKSTVCQLFSNSGRQIILADDLARRIADEHLDVKAAIKKAFGSSAYLPSGRLDRKTIASIVFANGSKRQKLNSIIHPRVFEAIDHQLDSLPPQQTHPYVLIEAALVYETGMNEWLDYVIVVTADEENCIQRVMARDNIHRDEVMRRIAAQMPMEKKVRQGDFIIQNNGSKTGLRSTVLFLDNLLCKIIAARAS